MKNKIKLAMALGLVGAVSAHAAIINTPLVVTSYELINQDDVVVAGGSITQTGGGNFRVGHVSVSSLTIDGGFVDITTTGTAIVGNGNTSAAGLIDLVSGSLDMDCGTFFLGRQGAEGIIRIQGGTATLAAMPTFDAINGGLTGVGSFDFTTANSGSLTVTGAVKADYEALYAGDDLTFNSGNSVAFDEQFSVSGSTITAIPEPATIGLIGMTGIGLMILRRFRI